MLGSDKKKKSVLLALSAQAKVQGDFKKVVTQKKTHWAPEGLPKMAFFYRGARVLCRVLSHFLVVFSWVSVLSTYQEAMRWQYLISHWLCSVCDFLESEQGLIICCKQSAGVCTRYLGNVDLEHTMKDITYVLAVLIMLCCDCLGREYGYQGNSRTSSPSSRIFGKFTAWSQDGMLLLCFRLFDAYTAVCKTKTLDYDVFAIA